jgi:short-subunit dehydrogenase
LRIELRGQGTRVLALHVGYIDTEMSKDVDTRKSDPRQVAARALDGLESNSQEVLADGQSTTVKASLSTEHPYYLNPPPIG